MPIIIPRKGPITLEENPPITQAQKDALWAHIVMAWTEKNQEHLISMLNPNKSEEQTD